MFHHGVRIWDQPDDDNDAVTEAAIYAPPWPALSDSPQPSVFLCAAFHPMHSGVALAAAAANSRSIHLVSVPSIYTTGHDPSSPSTMVRLTLRSSDEASYTPTSMAWAGTVLAIGTAGVGGTTGGDVVVCSAIQRSAGGFTFSEALRLKHPADTLAGLTYPGAYATSNRVAAVELAGTAPTALLELQDCTARTWDLEHPEV